MNIKNILDKELKLIKVSENELLKLKNISSEIIELLKQNGLNAFIGGSLAKGTLIKKTAISDNNIATQDVDIFVVFESSKDVERLEKILPKIKFSGNLKKIHGSRDYFHIDFEDVILEIIPVVKNSNPEHAENVTDVSLGHVKYILKEISKNKKISDEIKLAKAFCNAQRCYGAEGYIRGFSGYSLEILVIYFGSFIKFLKEIRKRRIIDPMKYYKNKQEILRELNSSKLQSPIIVVDPTYKLRNTCAGLGSKTFDRFLESSNKFLKNPNLEFFKKKDIEIEKIKRFALKRNAEFIEVSIETDRQEGDIAGTKMKKLFAFFIKELKRNEQKILVDEFEYIGKGQRAKGYLAILKKNKIAIRGPPINMIKTATTFKKTKGIKNVFEKKGFLWWEKEISVEEILKFVKRIEKEMGAIIDIHNNS